ncbi:endospore germination permease [Pullulanibacillus sp. KACC 23026]|uniref:GerAB/ArcD/ProY family transporter n=1 Tax=Pullulanibacillus sp. KACC 23026 TaxID=3028315 RepID=UPI0023B1E757|nr:endospore germination permease [Pullulanibacillus sp. KACC 23026]WEG12258.1 endospore germination permease [Pullulanibacillus sp. KACC 23026]
MRISGLQLFWMITGMEIGMTTLLTFNPALQSAKQDAWISVLVAEMIVFLIGLVTYYLCLLYPAQTLVQFSRTILGKWLGSFIVFFYIIQWYSIIPVVLRQYSDLIKLILLPHTPVIVIMAIMLILVIYAVAKGGIEGIARCSEVMVPVIIICIIIILLLSWPNIRISRLMPILADRGAGPIVKGALPVASYLGHALDLTTLCAFLQNSRKQLRYGLWGVYFSCILVLLSMLMTILTINEGLWSKEWYPFFLMSGKVRIANFIENMDPLVVIIWISSVFTKLSIYFFIACYGTAQWFGIKNWRVFIWILAPCMLVLGILPRNMYESTTLFLNYYWVPWVLSVNMFLLPLLLLLIGSIRKRINRA